MEPKQKMTKSELFKLKMKQKEQAQGGQMSAQDLELQRLREYNLKMAQRREQERKIEEASGIKHDIVEERKRRMEKEMKSLAEKAANPSPEPIIIRNQAH